MKKITKVLLLVAGIPILAVASLGSNSSTSTAFLVESPKLKNTQESVIASGNITFTEQVELRPEITGVVEEVLVSDGDIVQQNDVLIKLEQNDFRMNVESALADVRIREIELKRLQEIESELRRRLAFETNLNKSNFITDEEIARLRSKVKLASLDVERIKQELYKFTAELERSKDLLEKTVFRAPMDGVVLKVDVKPGEAVVAGTTNIMGSSILKLANPNSVVAELRIDEADINSVFIGQQVAVYLAADTKQALAGSVNQIGLFAEKRHSGAGLFYIVEIQFNEQIKPFSGMSCRAELLLLEQENVLTVPISALAYEKDQPFVWSVQDGEAVRKFLELGVSSDIEQSILSGLEATDRIIVGPVRAMVGLKEGDEVNEFRT